MTFGKQGDNLRSALRMRPELPHPVASHGAASSQAPDRERAHDQHAIRPQGNGAASGATAQPIHSSKRMTQPGKRVDDPQIVSSTPQAA